jgi:hypothetical protein
VQSLQTDLRVGDGLLHFVQNTVSNELVATIGRF